MLPCRKSFGATSKRTLLWDYNSPNSHMHFVMLYCKVHMDQKFFLPTEVSWLQAYRFLATSQLLPLGSHFFFFSSLCTSIPPIQLNHQRLESTEMVHTLNYPPWGSVSAGRLSAWPACWLHCKSNKTDHAPKNNHTKKHEVLASKLINATKANLPNRYPVIKVLEGFSGCGFFKLRNESAFPEWVNSISD